MNLEFIFILQLFLSIFVIALLMRWEVAPHLDKLPANQAMFWLIAPHAFRHIGMVFLAPGVVDPQLPAQFAYPAAFGDLLAGLLALTALISIRSGWRIALPMTWLFNTVGTIDLVNALSHAEAIPYLHASWFIPTFFVPILLVTHFMIFARLLRDSHSPVVTQ